MQLGGAQECLYLSYEGNDNIILTAIGAASQTKTKGHYISESKNMRQDMQEIICFIFIESFRKETKTNEV